MKSFLIIGLGSFGHHLCMALAQQRCEIMVVDKCGEALEDLLPHVVSAKIGDCTNVDVLRSFSVENFDACFVCMGSNVLSSLQITSLLKELGAKRVYSKADDDTHAKFLLRNGADEVIYPEREIASNIAISASSDNIFDCIRLNELNFRAKYNMTVIAVIKDGVIRPNLHPDYVFNKEEHLLVLGQSEDIQKVLH